MKKLISFSLILCILFSCSSFTVFAQEEQGEIIELCENIKFDTGTNTLYYSGKDIQNRAYFNVMIFLINTNNHNTITSTICVFICSRINT